VQSMETLMSMYCVVRGRDSPAPMGC
jgi:hypothetical protein